MRLVARMGRSAAVVMMTVVTDVCFVPMTMSVTDAAGAVLEVFRNDHWLAAGVRSTGECRHHQKRNNKNGKYNVLHDTLFGCGPLKVRLRHDARLVACDLQ
jgi:hypothetical protein